ncbi:MAG TPA: glycosyl hydrolase family 18 protein [Agriterribacter sp.]|nr:glycosyl hydrolase family 18 protein [Agriterribacter sp.]
MSTARAPYSFNPQRKLLASYDDARSVRLKTEYMPEHGLSGIMFWQLAEDKLRDGLLDAIDKVKRGSKDSTSYVSRPSDRFIPAGKARRGATTQGAIIECNQHFTPAPAAAFPQPNSR